MNEFKESKFYKLLQDFFINNDKETFLQMLAEFYNRTEGIIDKNIIQDEIIKELQEMYIKFNEEGIDENIVREKVNYFIENGNKIQDIITKINKNINNIKIINSELDTIENNVELNYAKKDDVAKISSGTPLFAASTTEMKDTTKNYVNTTDGYLYIYIDGNWEKTSVQYQSSGISDNSIATLKLNNSEKNKLELQLSSCKLNTFYEVSTKSFKNHSEIDCYIFKIENGETININVTWKYESACVVIVDSTFNTLYYDLRSNGTEYKTLNTSIIAPSNSCYLIINKLKDKNMTITKDKINGYINDLSCFSDDLLKDTITFPSETKTNYFLKNGNIGSDAVYEEYSNMEALIFNVKSGEKYRINTEIHNMCHLISFINDNNKLVGQLYMGNLSLVEYDKTITIPSNAKKMVINKDKQHITKFNIFKKEIYAENQNKNNGLIFGAIGDSTTWGDTGIGGGGNSISWVAHMQKLCGFSSVFNYGICGRKLAKTRGRSDSIVETYQQMNENLDVIFMMIGVNDFLFDTPLGNINSTEETNFYGALKIVANGLLTKYPNKKIIFATPLKCNHSTYGNTYKANNLGLKQIDYVNAIKEIADYHNIKVLDTYSLSGISMFNETQCSMFSPDKLHYNALGYEFLATETIAPYLNYLLNK